MNKSSLILKVCDKLPGQKLNVIKDAVNVFFDAMSEGIQKDERVELRGFGTFCLHEHSAKLAYNPKTGQRFYMSPKKVAYFRPSEKIVKQLNDKH